MSVISRTQSSLKVGKKKKTFVGNWNLATLDALELGENTWKPIFVINLSLENLALFGLWKR